MTTLRNVVFYFINYINNYISSADFLNFLALVKPLVRVENLWKYPLDRFAQKILFWKSGLDHPDRQEKSDGCRGSSPRHFQ